MDFQTGRSAGPLLGEVIRAGFPGFVFPGIDAFLPWDSISFPSFRSPVKGRILSGAGNGMG
ncbi:MAG: hypothetical protein RIS76_4293, partial [Verrucomicrobiota bacterium]